MPEETQDSPALAQNETTGDERLRGLVAQLRADVSGEDVATVETAVRRRLGDTGIEADEDLVRRLIEELSA